MIFDEQYYLKFGHHNDNVGTVFRHSDLMLNSKNCLIVPSGMGEISTWLSQNGVNVDSYDFSDFIVNNTNHKSLIKKMDLRELPLDKEYDLVVCLDLLEHFDIEDIEKSLHNITKVGKDKLLIRIGSEELDVFDEDPTHITKKDLGWWFQKITSYGWYLEQGQTCLGEWIFSKNPNDGYLFYEKFKNDNFTLKDHSSGHLLKDDIICFRIDKEKNISFRVKDGHINFRTREDGFFQIAHGHKLWISHKRNLKDVLVLFYKNYIVCLMNGDIVCMAEKEREEMTLCDRDFIHFILAN